jgi:two-component system LytT family response regulator
MIKTWNTIVIDDESLARQRLNRLLSAYDCICLKGEAANGMEGLHQIELLQPDLVFLDIEMPILNGFEMLGRLTDPPRVIFTTAYDQYAVKAFEEESVDYLLKPIEKERLDKSINKLKNLQSGGAHHLPLELLMKHIHIKKEIKTLTVKIGDRILLVKLQDLAFIEAEDKYVFLHSTDGTKNLTDFTISGLEAKLPVHFVKINRGILINTELIKEIRRGFNGSYYFIMDDMHHTKLSSSRGQGALLKEIFDL